MIDPTVWGPIILKITAEQRYFLKKEFGITRLYSSLSVVG